MFKVIRLEGEATFLIGKFLQVLYFPSTAVVKTENLEEGFFSNIELPIIGNYDEVSLQISCSKSELVEKICRGL